MSKVVFASLIKKHIPVSLNHIDILWNMALKAELPESLFNKIVPSLVRLPQVHAAYVAKCGFSPISVTEEQARRLILETFIEGPRYMSEIQRMFSIPQAMRQRVMNGLINDKVIVFDYCPVGRCVVYDLKPQLRAPKRLVDSLVEYLSKRKWVSLYGFSLVANNYDYSIMCVLARNIQMGQYDGLNIKTDGGLVLIGS